MKVYNDISNILNSKKSVSFSKVLIVRYDLFALNNVKSCGELPVLALLFI